MGRIGIWTEGLGLHYDVSVDDGIVHVKRTHIDDFGHKVAFKRMFGERYFGDREFLVGCGADYITHILLECNGMTEEWVREYAKELKGKRDVRRTRDYNERKRWMELKGKFGGFVIGIANDTDIYGSGFSVRVLLSAKKSFGERKRFVEENREAIWEYAIGEIKEMKRLMKKIGDIGFYGPDEMIVMRAPELELKFRVKGDIENECES